MVVEGEQVVVGDTAANEHVGYEVLCRRHHMRRMTAAAADALFKQASLSPDALPFDPALDLAACAVAPRAS
jgi:thymidine kinase